MENMDKNIFSGKLIPGIEVVTSFEKHIIEVLGYGVNTKMMNDWIAKNKRNDLEFAKTVYRKLTKVFDEEGIQYTKNVYHDEMFKKIKQYIYHDLLKYKENKNRIKEKVLSSFEEFVKNGLNNPNSIFFISEYTTVPTMEKVVDIIHQSGGLAFLAHIYQYNVENHIAFLNRILSQVKLDGIEVYHSSFSKEQIRQINQCADDLNLYKSGGSDYHGKLKPGIELGFHLQIPEKIVQPWINKIEGKMDSKKFYILAYTRENLGDDLFIYMLLKQYPDIQFHISIRDKTFTRAFTDFPNLTIHIEKERVLTKENAKDFDGYIYVGGSIFIESGHTYKISEDLLAFMKECKKHHIPFHYVSSNFGPYQTQKYFHLAREVFKNCTSICFRERYSKNLFQDIPTVFYAPDLAFSYKPKNTKKIPNTVGITLIDLSIRKDLAKFENIYYKMLKENIQDYMVQGKAITLFSFCHYEGDENAIQKLLETFPEEMKRKIKVVCYRGNLEEFLIAYAQMEYMVCARFHAMVLSCIMHQKCAIMSYSHKTDNVINDLQLFSGNCVRFDNLTEKTKMPLEIFKQLSSEKINNISIDAKQQLKQVNQTMEFIKNHKMS